MTDDTPLAAMYRGARVARIYDGARRGAPDGRRAADPARVRGRRHLALHVVLEGDARAARAARAAARGSVVGGRAGRARLAAGCVSAATRAARRFAHGSTRAGERASVRDGRRRRAARAHELPQRARGDRVAEIGNTWLARRAWGTGANTEAKLLLLQHAFERRGLPARRVQDGRANERSRAALAALPAEFEGVFRKHMLVRGGERRDSAWYA